MCGYIGRAHVDVKAVVLDESDEESGRPALSSHQEEPVSQTTFLICQPTHLERHMYSLEVHTQMLEEECSDIV